MRVFEVGTAAVHQQQEVVVELEPAVLVDRADAFARDEHREARGDRVRPVLVGRRLELGRPKLGHLLLDGGLARRRVEPLPLGGGEHDVEDAALLGLELGLDQVGGLLGVGAGDLELVAQAAADGRDERDQDDHDPEPAAEDAPWMCRAEAGPAGERARRESLVGGAAPVGGLPRRSFSVCLGVCAHMVKPRLQSDVSG